MEKLHFLILFLMGTFCAKDSCAQEVKDISKDYAIFSVYYSVPDNEQHNFKDVNFRFGWTNKEPFRISVQFFNAGYVDVKLKFAIKNETSNQMIILDSIHNSRFGTETLKANSDGVIWSGPVDNIKDSFSLHVWNSDGDEFGQAPISILNIWTQKPTNTPTPIVKTDTHNGKTAVSLNEPLLMPTFTQTPSPDLKSTYAIFGDSYAAGCGASSEDSTFWHLINVSLSIWYPTISAEHYILSGSGPEAWFGVLPTLMSDYKKKGIPVGYVLLEVGPHCFLTPNQYDCHDCCKGATLSEGVSYSYVYQKNMSELIGDIYAIDPGIRLVALTTPDSTAGKGTFAPTAVYRAYRQRLYELQGKYPTMRIADIFTAMSGHIEYFQPTGDPNHPNDRGQSIIARTVLVQFANWPYQPSKH
jgi:lysophospholipase L1-like esterase